MSKFFEALERAEQDQALRRRAAPSEPTSAQGPAVRETVPYRPLEPSLEPPRGASNGLGEHLVSLLAPTSFEADQYRVLRHVVETPRKGANLQIVGVTSPGVGDGKTATAINLAGALAQSAEVRVLLVDIDIRRPAVARQLGIDRPTRSLVDALVDSGLTLEDTVEHLAHFNLSVLPGGGPAVAPYELLKSPRLEALLDAARQRYDYIILDTPPFIPVPDCRLVTRYVDGFFVAVAAHRTPKGMLAETLSLIDPAKVVGLVFNGDDMRRSSYYDAYTGSHRSARWYRAWREP